jgi:hypothetical protein
LEKKKKKKKKKKSKVKFVFFLPPLPRLHHLQSHTRNPTPTRPQTLHSPLSLSPPQ